MDNTILSDVLGAVTTRQQNVANSIRGKRASDASRVTIDSPSGKTITLQLTATTVGSIFPVRPRGPASFGNPSIDQVPPQTTQTLASITFDIAPGPTTDGFAQNIVYGDRANQNTHITPNGFYADQFGMAPGQFQLTAIVVFVDDAAQRIQKFKDLLRKAKTQSRAPQAPTPAPVLRFFNSVDGRSLVLNQASLDVQQTARDPNQAVISISGEIFHDYATNKALSSGSSGNAASNPQASLVSFTDSTTDSSYTTTSGGSGFDFGVS